jgi:hypothetical protein
LVEYTNYPVGNGSGAFTMVETLLAEYNTSLVISTNFIYCFADIFFCFIGPVFGELYYVQYPLFYRQLPVHLLVLSIILEEISQISSID